MRDVTVLTLDKGSDMRAAELRVAWLIRELQEADKSLEIDIHLQRATQRSWRRQANAATQELMVPTGLLHVMAHGHGAGLIGHKRRRPLSLEDLREHVSEYQVYPEASGVLLDACGSFEPGWRRLVSEVLAPGACVVFIGSTRDVGFDEAAAYVNSFYATLLRTGHFPRGPVRQRRAFLAAHERAAAAYKVLMGRPAPFKAMELVSSN